MKMEICCAITIEEICELCKEYGMAAVINDGVLIGFNKEEE